MFISLSRRACAAALVAAFLSLPGRAAEPLSLVEAQALAVARSQQLAANNASITASREMAAAAGQLPDPVLKFGVENLPVNGPDRLSLSRDFMTMRRIGLSQELPRAQKRQLRAERFEREADRTRAEGQLNMANIQRDTAKAWIERYYTQQMRELVLRQMQETRLQAQTVESGFGVGRNSQADVFAARAALVMLEDRLSQLDKQERNAALMLARWVGPAAERPVTGAPAWQTSRLDDGRLDEHIQYHPDLVMLKAQVEAAQTEARLADANKKADWSVEAMYSQRGSAYSNMISLGVSVPLQWDQKNRQDREVSAKLAMAEQMTAQREEATREHLAETRAWLQEWQSNRDRLTHYDDALIPLASERTRAAIAAYRGGSGLLSAVLEARRMEIDTRMERLRLEMETAALWAQLEYLIPAEHVAAAVTEK